MDNFLHVMAGCMGFPQLVYHQGGNGLKVGTENASEVWPMLIGSVFTEQYLDYLRLVKCLQFHDQAIVFKSLGYVALLGASHIHSKTLNNDSLFIHTSIC